MKVAAVSKYTGEKICELEMKEREVEHIADVSCPDCTPERCRAFCPQFDGQEVR